MGERWMGNEEVDEWRISRLTMDRCVDGRLGKHRTRIDGWITDRSG